MIFLVWKYVVYPICCFARHPTFNLNRVPLSLSHDPVQIDWFGSVSNLEDLGPDWFKRSGYGCGCESLRMRVVAVSSGFKRFVRLVLRL